MKTMKSIRVVVCVCTQCIMNGAMDIIEAVESLKKLKYEMRHGVKIEVETQVCHTEHDHSQVCPVVFVDGQQIEKATNEEVMTRILSIVRK